MSDFGYAGVVPNYRSASEINGAMIRVYNNMFLAVLNSMVVSLLVSSSPWTDGFPIHGCDEMDRDVRTVGGNSTDEFWFAQAQ